MSPMSQRRQGLSNQLSTLVQFAQRKDLVKCLELAESGRSWQSFVGESVCRVEYMESYMETPIPCLLPSGHERPVTEYLNSLLT